MRAPAIEMSSLSDGEHIDGAIADQAIGALDRLSKPTSRSFLPPDLFAPTYRLWCHGNTGNSIDVKTSRLQRTVIFPKTCRRSLSV